MVKEKKLLILTLFWLVIFSGCADGKLTISNKLSNVNFSKLSFDGYYYHLGADSINTNLFLYKNGIVLRDYSKKRFHLLDSTTFVQELDMEQKRKDKTSWGIFNIVDDKITLQIWQPSSGGGLPVSTYYGKINNQESFIFKYVDGPSNRGRIEINREYIFHPLLFKPDSTNMFIK